VAGAARDAQQALQSNAVLACRSNAGSRSGMERHGQRSSINAESTYDACCMSLPLLHAVVSAPPSQHRGLGTQGHSLVTGDAAGGTQAGRVLDYCMHAAGAHRSRSMLQVHTADGAQQTKQWQCCQQVLRVSITSTAGAIPSSPSGCSGDCHLSAAAAADASLSSAARCSLMYTPAGPILPVASSVPGGWVAGGDF
jgi:hypothetical protein